LIGPSPVIHLEFHLEMLSWTSGFSWRGTAQESRLIQVRIPSLGRIQAFKATQIATKINK
jgi:hypothetical protein